MTWGPPHKIGGDCLSRAYATPTSRHGWVSLYLLRGHRWRVVGDRADSTFGGTFAGVADNDKAAMLAAERCAAEKFGVVIETTAASAAGGAS
jgi:hypothetical protein